MDFILTIGICVVLLTLFVRSIDFLVELLSKFLLLLHFPNGPLSLFFQILGSSVPFAVLCAFLVSHSQSQLIAGVAVGYAIIVLLGIPALIGLRHKGAIRTVISSQSLASILLGGLAFILVAIDQKISAPEGAVLLILCIAYLITGFSIPASAPRAAATTRSSSCWRCAAYT